MSTNDPLTDENGYPQSVAPDASSASSAPPLSIGSEHEFVYSIFRQDGTPVRKMILAAVVIQLLLISIICVMPYPWGMTAEMIFGQHVAKSLENAATDGFRYLWPLIYVSPFSFLALLAIPYVPGIILRRHFRDVVIPMCRYSCPGEQIFRGAMRSLRHMLARFVLALLPGLIIYLVPVVLTLGILIKIGCKNDPGEPLRIQASFSFIVWMYLLSLPGWLLSEYALAVFPVSRLFTRLSGAIRPGMFLMLSLIYLARIVFALNPVFTTEVLNPVFTAEIAAFLTVAVIVICTALSIGAIAYFHRAAKTDAGKWGSEGAGLKS